jgi:phage terminase small subunit
MKNDRLKTVPTALVPLEEADLSPTMRSLNPRQREFVRWIITGCTQKEAARRAGYAAKSEGSLEVQGAVTAHKPAVQQAIREESLKVMNGYGPKMIAVLAGIAMDSEANPRDRISAASTILDRGGYSAITSHRVDVHHHQPSREEIRARLAAACDELGFTPEMKARALKVNAIELDQQADGTFAVTEEPAKQEETQTQ